MCNIISSSISGGRRLNRLWLSVCLWRKWNNASYTQFITHMWSIALSMMAGWHAVAERTRWKWWYALTGFGSFCFASCASAAALRSMCLVPRGGWRTKRLETSHLGHPSQVQPEQGSLHSPGDSQVIMNSHWLSKATAFESGLLYSSNYLIQ